MTDLAEHPRQCPRHAGGWCDCEDDPEPLPDAADLARALKAVATLLGEASEEYESSCRAKVGRARAIAQRALKGAEWSLRG